MARPPYLGAPGGITFLFLPWDQQQVVY